MLLRILSFKLWVLTSNKYFIEQGSKPIEVIKGVKRWHH